MSFLNTDLHGPSCSCDLNAFIHPLLTEHGQQHDALALREALRDPKGSAVQVEPQLEEPAPQCARVRHAQQVPPAGEGVDPDLHRRERLQRQGCDPFLYLGLELNRPR